MVEFIFDEGVGGDAHIVLEFAAVEKELDAEATVVDGVFAWFEIVEAFLKLQVGVLEVPECVRDNALEEPADDKAWLFFSGFVEVLVGAVVFAEHGAAEADIQEYHSLVGDVRTERDEALVLKDGFFEGQVIEEVVGVRPDIINWTVLDSHGDVDEGASPGGYVLWLLGLFRGMLFVSIARKLLRGDPVVTKAGACGGERVLVFHGDLNDRPQVLRRS